MRIHYLSFAICVTILCPCFLCATEGGRVAVVPAFHDRFHQLDAEGTMQLTELQFVVFVYNDAAAVYVESRFQNTGRDSLVQEFALPSTGHELDDNEEVRETSNGILGVQMWVEGERVQPRFSNDGRQDWYTILTRFPPGRERVLKALFWCETTPGEADTLPGLDTTRIADGPRGFAIDLSHAAAWAGTIGSIDVTVVFPSGLLQKVPSFSAVPGTYTFQDSTLIWDLLNVDPVPRDDIFIRYTSSGNRDPDLDTMAKLGEYIRSTGYDRLLEYARTMFHD